MGEKGSALVEIKIAGRGGQGVVLASKIIAAALLEEGFWVQSFPSFGAERRGAPVAAFVRAAGEEITLRCAVRHPDWLLILDPALAANPLVLAGVTGSTSILVNSPRLPEALMEALMNALAQARPGRLFLVDATSIAAGLGLVTGSFPLVNTALTGAFARASGLVDRERILRAVGRLSPVRQADNQAAADQAFEAVQEVHP